VSNPASSSAGLTRTGVKRLMTRVIASVLKRAEGEAVQRYAIDGAIRDRRAEVAMLKYVEVMVLPTMTRAAAKHKPRLPVAGLPAY